jgi:DNA repair protein RecN (Recombination protein N)
MLTNLLIKNYALIKELNISIDQNLTTITGETGAGKSILLGAIGLVLGQRADNSAIADQSEKCIIEATFDIKNLNLKALFEEIEIDYHDECVIRREILPNGKSRSFINDTPANLNQLKQLGAQLIEVHTQNTGLLISNPDEQIHLLDDFGGYKSLIDDYKKAYSNYSTSTKNLNSLLLSQSQFIKEKEFIQFQFDEIYNFQPVDKEEVTIEEQIILLTQASNITQALGQANKQINETENSLVDQLNYLKNQIKPIAQLNDSISSVFTRLETTIVELKDIGFEAENLAEKIEENPAALDNLNDRLLKMQNLFRKHQVESAAELLHLQNELEIKLQQSQNIDDEIISLKNEVKKAKENAFIMAQKLSESRLNASKLLAEETKTILVNLAIPHAQIEFKVNTSDTELGPLGIDTVNILFSANLGKSPQLLSQVASGGEISRLNFTFRSLIAKNKNLPTLIYDEADTGISGEVASKMGAMMRQLGNFHQVISITHLPQVAAAGQNQWLVYKSVAENKTLSSVKKLDFNERITVLGQMLSGTNPTDAALSNAKELLDQYTL